jgi:hypothetical protein
MARLVISEDAGAQDMAPIALAVNALLGLPTTARSANSFGVRVENGKVLDDKYTGPVLEEVLRTEKTIRTIPNSGVYSGIPVLVAPIMVEGKAIAAIGVVDVLGNVDLHDIFGGYSNVVKQVSKGR